MVSPTPAVTRLARDLTGAARLVGMSAGDLKIVIDDVCEQIAGAPKIEIRLDVVLHEVAAFGGPRRPKLRPEIGDGRSQCCG